MFKLNKKKVFAIISSIIIISLMGIYLYQNRASFNELDQVNLIYLLPLSALILTTLYINGLFLKILALPFNIKLKKHFLLSLAASFFNLITPFRGGAGIRAVYMKKKYKLNYSHFLSSLLGNYLIIFLTASAFALISYFAIYYFHQIFNIYLFLIFTAIFLGNLTLITFHFSFKKENRFTSKINKVLQGWKLIAKHPQIILKLSLTSSLNLLLGAFVVQLSFHALGLDINFLQAFYLSIMGVLGIFINITPGSLGITESLYLISGSIIGIDPQFTLLIALIIRAINTILLLILGPISNYLLLKDLNHSPSA